MPFSAEFWVAAAIAAVALVLGLGATIAMDAKTKGEFRFAVGCFIVSAVAICYGIGTWEMNTSVAGKYRIPIVLILFAGVAMGTIETVRWAHGRHLRAAELAKPPDGGRETVTLKDEVKVAVKPAPAIKTEVRKAGPPQQPSVVPTPQQVPASDYQPALPNDEVGIGSVKIVDESGIPLKGAEVLFIRKNGTHLGTVASDRLGIVRIPILTESLTVFCADDGFSSYYQEGYNPFSPMTIKLKKSVNGGSVIFIGGTGYINGLSGRLNPILDTLGRTYLYAENIAIDGGKTQPVTFVINRPIALEDSVGHKFEMEVVAIIGTSSLIEYRRL
jgi:hypothetical protein